MVVVVVVVVAVVVVVEIWEMVEVEHELPE
jgi:hypothetical protein